MAASTKTGSKTRLDYNKARQLPLAGLVRFVRVSQGLRAFVRFVTTEIAGLTLAHFGPKSLELAQESRNRVIHPN